MRLTKDGNLILLVKRCIGIKMINLTIIELLQQVSPLLISAVTLMVLFSTIKLRKKMLYQEKQIMELHRELDALLVCSRGISDKLHFYQQQFKHIVDRQDKLELGEAETSSYKQAMALVNRGASEEELLTTCDLSRGELNLITHLQKSRKSSIMQ